MYFNFWSRLRRSKQDMKIRNSEELFDDLVNLNADQWNMKLAKELSMSVIELKAQFILRDKITNISEDRIKLDIYKTNIVESGNKQINTDNDSYKKLEDPSTPHTEREDILHKPTLLDRYSIRINEGNPIIDSISVTGKIIVGMDFSDAELDFSYFCHCVFYNCDFTNANLSEAVFQSCVFNSCCFVKADLSQATFSKPMMLDCNCDNSNLSATKFILASIISGQFNLSNLNSSFFADSGVVDCSFMNANLSSVEFVSSSITNCNLRDSNMKNAKITDMLCSRSDFRGCDLNHCTMTCFTSATCKFDPKFDNLFQMNHLLFSPGIVEWEENPNKEEPPPSQESQDDEAFL